MSKNNITRTFGPIHFEDLDPHRFEDLIRELIYDFKEWQSIEATGRGGSDDGFDIRAFEKKNIVDEEIDSSEDESHPMLGNLWMIQGKREKIVSPKKIEIILNDVNTEEPPYGYILAASANFSKKSYDKFREILLSKGVMEFYLWGNAEIEDMLHLPKNDRILFTFFGVSLISKKRSQSNIIKSIVNTKNKLMGHLGDNYKIYNDILIRDLNDSDYPYEDKCTNFDLFPRWKIFQAFQQHPLGLLFHQSRYFAYIDIEKKEWDYISNFDLIEMQNRKFKSNERNDLNDKREYFEDYWEFLPNKNKGYYEIDSIVRYKDMAVIDLKGDVAHNMPHIFVQFTNNSPFTGDIKTLNQYNRTIGIIDDFKRINIFPKEIPSIKNGKIYKNKTIILNDNSQKLYKEYKLKNIYSVDDRYNFLKEKDIIQIGLMYDEKREDFIQITHIFKTKIGEHLSSCDDKWVIKNSILAQIDIDPDDEQVINIFEYRNFYKSKFENK